MGSFSWMKANEVKPGEYPNVVYGQPFKFLIPVEFGGGFIIDNYQDYGYLGKKEDGSEKYDMYELLAFWNLIDKQYALKFDGAYPLMKEIDEFTDANRGLGIDIGCYEHEIDLLKYPLKLVSVDYVGTYEDCKCRSYGDPEQGCLWDEFIELEFEDEDEDESDYGVDEDSED